MTNQILINKPAAKSTNWGCHRLGIHLQKNKNVEHLANLFQMVVKNYAPSVNIPKNYAKS